MSILLCVDTIRDDVDDKHDVDQLKEGRMCCRTMERIEGFKHILSCHEDLVMDMVNG